VSDRAPKTWRGWGELEERRLIDLRAQGFTIAQCAAELGRSFYSVKLRVQQLGKAAAKHQPRRLDYLRAITAGLSNNQIAAELGVSRDAVLRYKRYIRKGVWA
jgi:DNA-binding NarL/FixJ family response regulator